MKNEIMAAAAALRVDARGNAIHRGARVGAGVNVRIALVAGVALALGACGECFNPGGKEPYASEKCRKIEEEYRRKNPPKPYENKPLPGYPTHDSPPGRPQ